jgi:hypothetical protein
MMAITIAFPVIGASIHIAFWVWFIWRIRRNRANKTIAAAQAEPEMEAQALMAETNGESGDVERVEAANAIETIGKGEKEAEKTVMGWESEKAESVYDLEKPVYDLKKLD